MPKIRAYKLAEELGIERSEFVEKAHALGVSLKSAVASLAEADVALLREKLSPRGKQEVVEQRVERKSGTVIRRRKRAAPPPPAPAPGSEPEPAASPEASASALEPAPGSEPEAASVEEVPTAVSEPELPPAPEPPPATARARAEPARERPTEARPPGPGKGKGRERKRVREVVNLREQEKLVRQVGRVVVRRSFAADPRSMVSPRRKRRDALPPKRPAAVAPTPQKRALRIASEVSVAELAKLIGAKAPELQGKLMALGTMASLHQAIDVETARKVAETFGYEVLDVGFREESYLETGEAAGEEARREPRPPIVTVMGHVDHGKTSLLDAIRKSNVVGGEVGGITQHIGAYQAEVGGGRVTFIDTPGHAAFTAMRARGANVTDLVVLVVAANDGIMPQTVEAIDHAKAAGVPILVAVNKIDLPDANSQTIRQRLMEHDLVTEDFGGDTICVDVSAKKGTGLDHLLEMIKLQAEVLELKADPERRASGVVLEAELDRGRGPLATVLVKDGTLRIGDVVVLGESMGKVRAMRDERGKRVTEAGPSTPVQVLGLQSAPNAGDAAHVVESERVAKEIVEHRGARQRSAVGIARPKVSLEDLFARGDADAQKELAIVLKADVQGSIEALRDALEKLSTEAVTVTVVHAGVGAISESDVMLARASGAIVIGFHVRPDSAARRAAEGQGVDVRHYRIIYEATDDIKLAMAGLLPPTIEENVLGQAEVRQTFQVPRIGTIAGCYVTEGMVRRNAQCRLLRDGVEIYSGRVGSLKRFKDDAREVQKDFECGIGIEGYNDVKIGDVIEVFTVEEKPATL